MPSQEFVFKPVSEADGNLVVLTPASTAGSVRSVSIVDGQGNVLETSSNSRLTNGSRPTFRFTRPGSSFGNNVTVQLNTDQGPVNIPVGSGGDRFTAQGGVGGGGGSPSNIISDAQGNQVSIPGFVEFNPEEFFINLDQAIAAADEQGLRNIGRFIDNFGLGRDLAQQTLETEIAGLEFFVPRASDLIRQADAQGNEDILRFSDIFDARNLQATQTATQANVAQRRELLEQVAPGTAQAVAEQLQRSDEDIDRIRSRSLQLIRERGQDRDFLTPILEEQAITSARNRAQDQATAGGFGTQSTAARSFIDRFDIDERIRLEQLQRQEDRAIDADIRGFESDIQGAEQGVRRAIDTGQAVFGNVVAPGIVDFQPLQPAPRVTDIGRQISPTPTVDAGTLQRGFASELTDRSTISPSQVFQGSFTEQQFNSGIGREALAFEQDVFNTISAGENNLFDKTEQSIREAIANAQFQEGLDAREQSQFTQGLTSLITGGLGSLINGTSGGFDGILGGVFNGILGGEQQVGVNGGIFGGASIKAATPTEIASIGNVAASIPNASLVAGGEAIIIPQASAVPTGYAAIGSAPLADGGAGILVAPQNGTFLTGVNAFLPALGVTAGAGVGALQFSGAQKILNGESPSIAENLALFPITGGLNVLGGAVGNVFDFDSIGESLGFGSGKSESQQRRDGIRDFWKEQGGLQDGFQLTLADGSVFKLGAETSQLQNQGVNIDGKTTRSYFDVDFSNPLSGSTVGFTNPLATILFGPNNGRDMVGHLTNAVMESNPNDFENIKLNAQGIAADFGVGYSDGIARLDQLRDSGGLTPQEYQIYRNGWYNLYFS